MTRFTIQKEGKCSICKGGGKKLIHFDNSDGDYYDMTDGVCLECLLQLFFSENPGGTFCQFDVLHLDEKPFYPEPGPGEVIKL